MKNFEKNKDDDISLLSWKQLRSLWEQMNDPEDGFTLESKYFLPALTRRKKLSKSQIKLIMTNLQNFLWVNRDRTLRGVKIKHPMDVMDPEILIELMGYTIENHQSLGTFEKDDHLHQAGAFLDIKSRVVAFSETMSATKRLFTAAHEFIHIFFKHFERFPAMRFHRDLPVSGENRNGYDNHVEREADLGALHLLMPEKMVCEVFRELFLTDRFELNEETAFALNKGSVTYLRSKLKTLYGFALFMASITFYHGVTFHSMAERFGVSEKAMAIRLMELKRLKFWDLH